MVIIIVRSALSAICIVTDTMYNALYTNLPEESITA